VEPLRDQVGIHGILRTHDPGDLLPEGVWDHLIGIQQKHPRGIDGDVVQHPLALLRVAPPIVELHDLGALAGRDVSGPIGAV
jgi:hypothetical protein